MIGNKYLVNNFSTNQQIRDITHQVYELIKDKILNLEIGFGERINLKELCDQVNVSSTPVLHAMKKLIEDGLVTYKPRKGYYVFSPTPKDVREIYELRKIIESYALTSLANKSFNIDPFKKLKKRIEYIKKQPQRERKNKFAETEVIHALIVYTLNNQRVRNIYEKLYNFTLFFQHIIRRDAVDTTDEGLEAHLSLANAIIDKDFNKAQEITKEHVETTCNRLCKLVVKHLTPNNGNNNLGEFNS